MSKSEMKSFAESSEENSASCLQVFKNEKYTSGTLQSVKQKNSDAIGVSGRTTERIFS